MVVSEVFFVFLVVDGALAGAIYALVALAFVVVYKASRMINFAVGEWTMVGSRVAASASHAFGLGLGGALGLGCVGMVALALVFNRVILRPLISRSLLSLIMVTIGVGIFMRGAATVVFAGIPARIASPFPLDPLVVGGLPVSVDKIVAAAIAVACIAALSWFFQGSRTGLALRAVASGAGGRDRSASPLRDHVGPGGRPLGAGGDTVELRVGRRDRKSTRLNSSHLGISYAVFCLKKKKKKKNNIFSIKKKKKKNKNKII